MFLKLNKEKLRELAALDDASLIQQIYSAAQKFGYTLPQNALGENEIKKIRSVMQDSEKISAMEIARLLSSMKEKKNKE